MTGRAAPTDVVADRSFRWLARTALSMIGASIALMFTLGVEGPIGPAAFSPSAPWPPWFLHSRPSPDLWSLSLWLAEVLGTAGLVFGLAAVRRGWRPRPGYLVALSVVAVAALMLVPPVDNGDPVMYAAFGRITALGHSPYVMTPGQLRATGDPVGSVVPSAYWHLPSRYGPVTTATEAGAAVLGGPSAARTIFWMKLWNAFAYLALVLALDRAVRSCAARRARAHLMWSLNPLMLLALMANGHNDVLPAAAGAAAIFAMRQVSSRRALLAGILLGLATAAKAQYALFGAGLAWAARRSSRALAALALGAAAIAIPAYLLAGRAAITATAGLTGVAPIGPWVAAARILGWQHRLATTNMAGLIASAVLAAILLWRMPAGPRDLPAVRIALALALGLLVLSPIQTAGYDAMIFPLLAVMPATRLDWITVARAAALAAACQSPVISQIPAGLSVLERISTLGSPTAALAAIAVALLWLCATRAWTRADRRRDLLLPGSPADRRDAPSPAG